MKQRHEEHLHLSTTRALRKLTIKYSTSTAIQCNSGLVASYLESANAQQAVERHEDRKSTRLNSSHWE